MCEPLTYLQALGIIALGGGVAVLASEGIVSLVREHRQRREIKRLMMGRRQAG